MFPVWLHIHVCFLKELYQPYKEGILENTLVPGSSMVGFRRHLGPEPQHEWWGGSIRDNFQRHFKDTFERTWLIGFKGSGEVRVKDDGRWLPVWLGGERPHYGSKGTREQRRQGGGGEIMSPIWSILGFECLWARQASCFLKIKGL